MKNVLASIIIYSVLMAFAISILIGMFAIPVLHKLKFGQFIRKEGPKEHQRKAGTPTMGGVIFILTTAVVMILVVNKPTDEAMIALYAFIAFGFVGFLDDILKIIHRNNLGLRAYEKMILLLFISFAFAVYGYKNQNIGAGIIVPFINSTVDLKFIYIPFIIVFFAATTNAVNLTDGLDGLASTVTVLVMTFFAILCIALHHNSLAVFCAVVVGALLGFLRFNSYPAKVIMGDTGSLALGGAVAIVALILKLPLIVLIVGGIYVIEALSVILQVASFKLTGKRIFKMAPIHHHFELAGWHETKVVSIFSIITIILCLVAFLSF